MIVAFAAFWLANSWWIAPTVGAAAAITTVEQLVIETDDLRKDVEADTK